MGRPRFRGRSQRAATGPPQETQSPWRPVVDLTGDALPFNASAPGRMALPLAPASGYKTNSTSIEVPLDPKQSPAYLFQQMALIRNRARNQPSFSSIVRPQPDLDSGTSSDLGPEDKENTPTPNGSRQPKGKPEKRSRVASNAPGVSNGHQEKQKTGSSKKRNREASSGVQERHTSRGRDKTRPENDGVDNGGEINSDPTDGGEPSARPRKKAKLKSKSKKTKDKRDAGTQQGEEEGENSQNNVEAENATVGTTTGTKSKKRKRGRVTATEEQNPSSAESKALKQLREILPTKRVSRVETQLRQEMLGGAGPPTETTVVVTAARDTIIDLARQQVTQTERSYQAIQAELLRMLKEQNKKLARWERRAKTTIGLLGSSNEPDSDSDAVVVVGSSSSSGDENDSEAAREEAEEDVEPEVEGDAEEDEAPKRKKKKKNKKKDEKKEKKRKHRSVSPVSIRRRRRAATDEPHPRSSCQSGVQ